MSEVVTVAELAEAIQRWMQRRPTTGKEFAICREASILIDVMATLNYYRAIEVIKSSLPQEHLDALRILDDGVGVSDGA